MRYFQVPAWLCLLLAAGPAAAQFHHEAERAHREYWRQHPEHPEEWVRSWHQRLFHGAPVAAFINRWVDVLRRGTAPDVVVAQILASPEYFQRVGGTPEAFVRTMFVDIVGRPPTPSELNFWLNRFYHEDRYEVAQALVTRYPPAWVEAPAPVETRVIERPRVEPRARVETYEYRRPERYDHRDRDRDRR